MKISLQKPFFNKKEEKAIIEVLRSGWVTQGPKVEEFEQAICRYTGAKYAVAVTSCTTGLFLCLKLLGIGKEDEVIVPSFSFIATANVVVHAGANPVFVDINPQTYNIDLEKLERAITPKTKVIIPVDQVGLPCDLDAIKKITQKYKLEIVQDAACALGSIYKDQRVGSSGNLAVFSFHPRKPITTGEGGVIVTGNVSQAKKLKMLRHHGMSVSDVVRHKTKKIIKESYPVIGFNFRMSDLQAAVGVEQMKKLPLILKKRASLANRYSKAFSKSKNIIPPFIPEGYVHNFQSYIIRLRKNKKITRDNLMQKLLDLGVSTRIGVMAAHLEPVYTRIGKISLLETEAATKETITLPLYFQMTKNEQDFVISKVLELTEG